MGRGHLSRIRLIAVQPEDISLGVELSPTIEAVMPEVLAQAEVCG